MTAARLRFLRAAVVDPRNSTEVRRWRAFAYVDALAKSPQAVVIWAGVLDVVSRKWPYERRQELRAAIRELGR